MKQRKDLPVQVHTFDECVEEHERGQFDKFEKWYVIDADKDTKLTDGFKQGNHGSDRDSIMMEALKSIYNTARV